MLFCRKAICVANLSCFVAKQFLSKIYALLSVKLLGLKMCQCKKKDKYEVCEWLSQSVTRSPNELLWTAKNIAHVGSLSHFVFVFVFFLVFVECNAMTLFVYLYLLAPPSGALAVSQFQDPIPSIPSITHIGLVVLICSKLWLNALTKFGSQ